MVDDIVKKALAEGAKLGACSTSKHKGVVLGVALGSW